MQSKTHATSIESRSIDGPHSAHHRPDDDAETRRPNAVRRFLSAGFDLPLHELASGDSLRSPPRAFTQQAGRFALIGSAGTGAALALYYLLGHWMDPLVANAAAWLITTLTTNGFQRRVAFGVIDPERATMDHAVALFSSLISVLASTAVLALFTNAGAAYQLFALVAVSSVVGAVRFAAVRWWLGHVHR